MARYYIDFTNGNDGWVGNLANPWATLDKYTGLAVAGDECVVRRGMTQAVGADLTFLNDGAITNPITLEADYENANWPVGGQDFVDLSATALATLAVGSKIVVFTAAINGVLAANDWIHVTAEDNKLYAYEVEDVSGDTVTVTLYLPYKGHQAGAARAMTRMPYASRWNTAAGSFEVDLDNDHYWKFQGLWLRGTDVNGVFEYDSVKWAEWRDCIFETNGSGDFCLRTATYDAIAGLLSKCRFYNYSAGLYYLVSPTTKIKDCLFDGNNINPSRGIYSYLSGSISAHDSEFKNHVSGDIACGVAAGQAASVFKLRNCLLSSATEFDHFDDADATPSRAYSEDHDQVENANKQAMGISLGLDIINRDTVTVRPAGATSSIKITPTVDMSPNLEIGRLELFNHELWMAAGVAKTLDVYFNLPAAVFTAAPLAGEMYLEFEGWGDVANPARLQTVSTGVVLADGNWNAIQLVVTPLQTGVAYLRAYYCKTLEGGASTNICYCDPQVDIT